jgi:hypothetical protein
VTAIAKALSSVIFADSPDLDIFKTIALFCGIGLLVSLLLAAGLSYLPAEPHTLDAMDCPRSFLVAPMAACIPSRTLVFPALFAPTITVRSLRSISTLCSARKLEILTQRIFTPLAAILVLATAASPSNHSHPKIEL